MKVALVHYWLVNMRGGEKVLEQLCELFPQADIFTHVYDPAAITESIKRHSIQTTFINKLPKATRWYKTYLPLMPMALEQLDMQGYDLVISSESGPAKGLVLSPGTRHICYCHTPMRYVWDMYHQYYQEAGWATRIVMPFIMQYLRMWDFTTASRVDRFIANSAFVAQRIEKYYKRDSIIIHPPVETSAFHRVDNPDDFYLYVGQLTAYKRADLAVKAFNELGKRLVIIGDGEQNNTLRRMANPNIEFLGRQDDSVLRDRYARCKALIFPGIEDFGLVPVEAMASGRPVIAFREGGALETVVEDKTGLFFDEATPESLIAAVNQFESRIEEFDPAIITAHAKQFDSSVFQEKIRIFVDEVMQDR